MARNPNKTLKLSTEAKEKCEALARNYANFCRANTEIHVNKDVLGLYAIRLHHSQHETGITLVETSYLKDRFDEH